MNTIPLDKTAVQRAIALAESQTSGEIRVVVYPRVLVDPLATAELEFGRLGMHRTRLRNAVLILVAPEARKFAIYGDRGVHEKCGERFWISVATVMTEHFRRGAFTEGIVRAVEETGSVLAKHFPPSPEDENQLPDDVVDRGTVI